MEIKIEESKITFYIDDDEKMVMDFYSDEFIWLFKDSNVVSITKDMELYSLFNYILNQDYNFSNDTILKDYKDKDTLIWYSDCYYNPDDEWSKNNVSFLTIKKVNDEFQVFCTKTLDDIINRKNENHTICFSTAGNGKHAININTGTTLQDDIVINIYQYLLSNNKLSRKRK